MNTITFPLLLTRGFAAMIRLYPERFRQEFGEEMNLVFFDQIQNESPHGPAHLIGICLSELPHLLLSLIREHIAARFKGQRWSHFLQDKPTSHWVWFGGLVFGLAAGLSYLFGIASGLSILEFTKFTTFTILVSFLSVLFFYGVPAGVFWKALPRRDSRSGFLFPALGVSIFSMMLLIGTILAMPPLPIHDQTNWWFWAIGRVILGQFLMGFIFGGLFGWGYFGWQSAFSFALVGSVGKMLSYLLIQGSITLTYRVFHLTDELVRLCMILPWFNLWLWMLTILGGMIFGGLLGWQVSISEKRNREARWAPPLPLLK